MPTARNLVLVWVAVVAMAVASANAQVEKFIPDSAMVFVHVNNLEGTSKKVADLAGALGLVQVSPGFADPLGTGLKQMGATQGVNRAGDLGFAYLDSARFGGSDKSFLLLMPVSDYQAFIGNYGNAKTEGEITTIQFPNDDQPSYVAHWGDYAAISPVQQIVGEKPTSSIAPTALADKELQNKDLVIYANFKAIRPKVLPALQMASDKASSALDQMAQGEGPFPLGALGAQREQLTKAMPLVKVVVNQAIDLGREFIQDTDSMTYSTNLSADGIGSTFLAEFQPESMFGTAVSQQKNTDATLLNGLPDTKYLFYLGSTGDPKLAMPVVSRFLDPIQKQVTDMGAAYAPINDYIDALKAQLNGQASTAMGMVAPSGALGQDALLQFVQVRKGDAKAIQAAIHKMFDAQDAIRKSLNLPEESMPKQTYTADAKTVDGVSFDLYQTQLSSNAQTMQAQQMAQFMMFAYGPNGMQMYSGVVNDQTLLVESGLNDQTLSAAIAAAKSNDDPLDKSGTLKAVTSQLPTQRTGVFFLPLDLWASTGLNYAKQFSMDMGVKIPEDLPPIGATFGTDGAAIRVDSYVPTQLIQALTSAGMQLYMSQHNGGPGGAPGGGGL